MYQMALYHEPNDPTSLSNYGLFLQTVRHEYVSAEESYVKALEIDVGHVHALCNYATLLTSVKKDYERAVSILTKAPYNASVLKCLEWVRSVQAAEKAQRFKPGQKKT